MYSLSSVLLPIERRHIFLLLIPLALSAFTHIWNPSGFPDFFYDEGVYIRRAFHVMSGQGPQDGTFYDHPFFGQIFLASVLSLINYPASLNPIPGADSIAMLYSIPRIVMGILAVADTFLIYKISEYSYNNNRRVAFVASLLFAVMPITWFTRRILLDSILLPFLLSSILFAVYASKVSDKARYKIRRKKAVMILLSGIFLGLAIFTKAPMVLMIPLVAYLVYKSNNNHLERKANDNITERHSLYVTFALWLVPVILIPLIWPAQSIAAGQLDLWVKSVIEQTQRSSNGIVSLLWQFYLIDPLLLLISSAGLVYAVLKRDLLILLWAIPFLLFFSSGRYVQSFYWMPILPAFCIASAKILDLLSRKIMESRRIAALRIRSRKENLSLSKLVPIFLVGSIAVFGFTSTVLLVTTDMTSAQIKAAVFILDLTRTRDDRILPTTSSSTTTTVPDVSPVDTTIISSPSYSWLFTYVFHRNNVFGDYRDLLYHPVRTTDAILVADPHFEWNMDAGRQLQQMYYNETKSIATFTGNVINYDLNRYPYTSLGGNYGGSLVDVRIRNGSNTSS
jgi:hypothetical protein